MLTTGEGAVSNPAHLSSIKRLCSTTVYALHCHNSTNPNKCEVEVNYIVSVSLQTAFCTKKTTKCFAFEQMIYF